MSNIKDIYHDLTGVDITAECDIWDERGKGYYGEFLVFQKIYPALPGTCKILMNLNIPTPRGKTTEIDLLLIHETGLYVFEIKHYKGDIYGKVSDPKWTQYFRTTPNCTFRNPVHQNKYHIDALTCLYPDIPIYSYIVFTHPECRMHISHSNPHMVICTLQHLLEPLQKINQLPIILKAEDINRIFVELLPYSPLMNKTIKLDDDILPLHQYISFLIQEYHNNQRLVEERLQSKEIALRKKVITTIATSVLAVILCATLSIVLYLTFRTHTQAQYTEYQKQADAQVAEAQKELSELQQKFKHVEKYNNGNITLEKGFITANNVQLWRTADVKNAACLQFTLNWHGEYYGAGISRDTKIIVTLKDGSVREYDLLESTFPYASSNLHLGKGNAFYGALTTYRVPVHELADIDIDEISYIKLSPLYIWVTEDGGYQHKTISTGYEVEIIG